MSGDSNQNHWWKFNHEWIWILKTEDSAILYCSYYSWKLYHMEPHKIMFDNVDKDKKIMHVWICLKDNSPSHIGVT
jgi:hypothetical protein